jgi:hypothetical protein
LRDPEALYTLSWDTATVQSHGFRLADFEAASQNRTSPFALAAGQSALVMKDGVAPPGMLGERQLLQRPRHATGAGASAGTW